jgi:hypothetical protein
MKEMRDGTSLRITVLETKKLDTSEHERHLQDYVNGEKRLRGVENKLALYTGGLIALQIVGWVVFEILSKRL